MTAILVVATAHGLTAERGPTVFAAASLKTALDAIAEDWRRETGANPVISYAATSALAKQIEQGAEADVFISADLDWMDYVEERGLIDPKSRFDLLANQLVLIAPKNAEPTAAIEPGLPLAELLGGGRLAIANVDAVPAGKYGKTALQSLGLWDAVKDKLAQAENVRAALRLVARGEAPLGIVYASDAKADPSVTVLGVFPEATHPPIVYPAASLRDARGPQIGAFLAYLRSPEAARRFEANGFAPIGSR
ncbi:MAG: molybdate ABC transporter substrate-binding protein [Hyphomicrobiales bacterium]